MKQLIIVLLCLSVGVMNAQETNKFSYGPKAGLNLVFIPDLFEEIDKNQPKPRFNFGAFVNWKLNQKWDIQGEVNYSLEGTDAVITMNLNGFPAPIQLNVNANLNYISLPISARYNFYENFYMGAGVFAAFLVKNKFHVYSTKDFEETYNASLDATGDFQEILDEFRALGRDYQVTLNNTDLGVLFEGGFIFDSGIDLNVRYSQGLSTILKGTDLKVSPKNQMFFIGLGYRFKSKTETADR